MFVKFKPSTQVNNWAHFNLASRSHYLQQTFFKHSPAKITRNATISYHTPSALSVRFTMDTKIDGNLNKMHKYTAAVHTKTGTTLVNQGQQNSLHTDHRFSRSIGHPVKSQPQYPHRKRLAQKNTAICGKWRQLWFLTTLRILPDSGISVYLRNMF